MLELRQLGPGDWRLWREVRLAALTDAPYAFSSTLAQWSGDGDAEERWRKRLDDVPLNLVALVDDVAVAQASGTAVDDAGRVEVISMWVAPDLRGAGVGDALLGAVEDWAVGEGASALVLAVKRTNEPALRLYHRVGFCRTIDPAGDPSEEIMVKPAGALVHQD